MYSKRSAQNILGHELIGLEAKIKRGEKEHNGAIVWETKNCIELEKANRVVKVPKKESTIETRVGGKRVRIDGRLLAYRPEDRTKVFVKKYWRKTAG